jgi:hypothetical protein
MDLFHDRVHQAEEREGSDRCQFFTADLRRERGNRRDVRAGVR